MRRYRCWRRLATLLVGFQAFGVCPAWSGEGDREAKDHFDNTTPHTIGLFVGDTSENRRVGLTLGLEYEYRISERYGIGLTAEYIGGDFQNNVFVVPFARHHGPWKLYAGPGFESGEKGDHPLFRMGVEYGFHWKSIEIAPQVDLDMVDGQTLFVVGVVFARQF